MFKATKTERFLPGADLGETRRSNTVQRTKTDKSEGSKEIAARTHSMKKRSQYENE